MFCGIILSNNNVNKKRSLIRRTMRILEELEPKQVFYYFEEICNIPHGSGNVDQISDFLADFGRKHGLEVYQDELKNVILIKEATKGYEEKAPIILQGHMDRVCVKKQDCVKDMQTQGLDLFLDGEYIGAKGTSLGGDDGIAVAYILAILSSDHISHPRLEAIITVDEEVGMEGATGIDLSILKGKQLLNIDSEEEGYLLTSCAGGARVKCKLPVEYKTYPILRDDTEEASRIVAVQIKISGLIGGHSGVEIHKMRANANLVLATVLKDLLDAEIDFSLVSMSGGVADNAIAASARCVIAFEQRTKDLIFHVIQQSETKLRNKYSTIDPELRIEVSDKDLAEPISSLIQEDFEKALELMLSLPNGVQAMSQNIEGLVETSLNMGILKLDDSEISLDFAVRSSVSKSKEELIDIMKEQTVKAGGYCLVSGEYPAWEYRVDSPLRDKMCRIYEEMYGVRPIIQAIHAGLECGILASKIDGLDCISFGPDMKDIHTAEERLHIASTKRTYDYLLRILAES